MSWTIESAKAFIQSAQFCLDDEESSVINLNDAFYWACADCEEIPEECWPEVADLFFRYGQCGVFYWVLKRRGITRVEFEDVNRHVEFVRQEEAIRAQVPSDSERAYHKASYTLGPPVKEGRP